MLRCCVLYFVCDVNFHVSERLRLKDNALFSQKVCKMFSLYLVTLKIIAHIICLVFALWKPNIMDISSIRKMDQIKVGNEK